MLSNLSNPWKRVLFAIGFLPVLFSALWLGSPIYFIGLATVAIVLGLDEYHRLAKCGGRVQGFAATAAILLAFYFQRIELVTACVAALVIFELLAQLFAQRDSDDLTGVMPEVSARLFGVLYVAVLGGYIIALRLVADDGNHLSAKLLTLFFVVVFAGDTGAYYTGRTLGKHKLAPRISPGKTIEGAIGGLLGNVLAAIIAHHTFFPELPLPHTVPLALVMGFLGTTGDLCESMLKRGAKAKDAGHLIPGHGGLLDRLDSMLFNAPLLYYYAVNFLR
jgi:phosphatidate cytidylyltransferase